MIDKLVSQLKTDEGLRLEAYQDTLGNWTIGYGHTGPDVTPGLKWTQEQAEKALRDDLNEALYLALTLPWFNALNEPRRAALVNMFFQMGNRVFKFDKTLDALRDGRYDHAKALGLQSKWAKQTTNRARRVLTQIATGEWEY